MGNTQAQGQAAVTTTMATAAAAAAATTTAATTTPPAAVPASLDQALIKEDVFWSEVLSALEPHTLATMVRV